MQKLKKKLFKIFKTMFMLKRMETVTKNRLKNTLLSDKIITFFKIL